MPRRILDTIIRPLELPADPRARTRLLGDTEWLVTNGIGGYSSSSVGGGNTRRYHGFLVAALPNPLGRFVMLSHLDDGLGEPTAFRLDAGLPVWEWTRDTSRVERRLLMPHGQNTVMLTYRLLDGDSVQLTLSPAVHFRGYEESVTTETNSPRRDSYRSEVRDGWLSIRTENELPPLRIRSAESSLPFINDPRIADELEFHVERDRGYNDLGAVWIPGRYMATLSADHPIHLIATVEEPDVALAIKPHEAFLCEHERRRKLVRVASDGVQDPIGVELTLAADQFIITPKGRMKDATRAKAMGDEIRTIIAGYHWFTDWGRDTMISLEGLTLVTGRHREAAFILRTFGHYVRDGLIPNMFPDGSNVGLYHTADATLWFFHAVERYRRITGDDDLLVELLPTVHHILEKHIAGTCFGIGMDPDDALLRQGAEGYQLTWMDAKVDGWVVTPRRGKAVEINALWYNALCLGACWTDLVRGGDSGRKYRDLAIRARSSFNRRFWNEKAGYLFDVVDGMQGDDSECRPNQLFAISLENPVLDRSRWEPVLKAVEEKLLTPVGLRSLAPGEEQYKAKYFGDLRARDAAYHQGTVWGWLIGPWIDAWLKLHPDDVTGARRYLDGLIAHLDDFGIGTIAEIFDATEPFTARGCIAQAWSVAEVLRCWEKTAG
jgi:predicted glycogen debranching enzyme